MPDIIFVLTKRWKLIFALTAVATVLSLIISVLRPKEYVGTATALPANSLATDKARIFNNNIEALYPEIGTPDELDRIEGTAKLDTIYLAVAGGFNLVAHYGMNESDANHIYKTALALKKNTEIRRSAFGELKISVWDGDPALAAQLANALLDKLNEIHQHVQSVNNGQILQNLKQELAARERELDSIETEILSFRINDKVQSLNEDYFNNRRSVSDTNNTKISKFSRISFRSSALQQQIRDYSQIIPKYELAISTNQQVLIAVENARPPISADKPKTLQTVLFAFGASFIFSFLLALFAESRKEKT